MAAFVVACGSQPSATGVQPSEPSGAGEASASRVADATPYPIEWARELPDGLVVQAIYDSPSGDALLIGELRADVWLSGAALSPDDYSHAIARFEVTDGTQLWAAGATAVVGLDLDVDDRGRTIWMAENRDGNVYLSRVNGETGVRTLVVPVGQWLPGTALTIGETQAERLREGTNREPMIDDLQQDDKVVPLRDGSMLVVGDKSIQVLDASLELRWSTEHLASLFVVETESGDLAAQWAASDGEVFAGVLSAQDGSVVWKTSTGASYGHIVPFWASIVEGSFMLVSNALGPTRTVAMVDMGGTLSLADEIRDLDMIDPSTLYAVRTRDGRRELVKLGPCPVEQCVVEAP